MSPAQPPSASRDEISFGHAAGLPSAVGLPSGGPSSGGPSTSGLTAGGSSAGGPSSGGPSSGGSTSGGPSSGSGLPGDGPGPAAANGGLAARRGELAVAAGGLTAGVAGLAVATSGLTKRFRSGQVAVDSISLAVPAGSVYGFLGPNGSGKTTTIRMLLGLVQPTSGSHQLLGTTMPAGLNAVLPRVGSLVEGPAFYSFLSGRANLARCDAADRTADPRTAARRIAEAMDRVGLSATARKHYRAYSLGMKQRLAIAAGLLRPRELMILDEPTNGLDPQGTREVRALIRQIAADGTTVFVSSHLLAEVEQICSHVGVMRTGTLVFQGTLEDLRDRGTSRILVRTAEPALASQVLTRLGLADVRAADTEVSAQLGGQPPEEICAELVHAGVPVAGLETPRSSLEDLFVELTGEGFNVNG